MEPFKMLFLIQIPGKLHLIVEMNQSPGKLKFEDQAKILQHGILSTILSAV